MYVLRTKYPYIGDTRIPLNYYSLLYIQLEAIWKELLAFLDELGISYEKKMHNLKLVVDDENIASVLSRLHQSFMQVEGYYDGAKIDRKHFLKHLWEEYNPKMIDSLEGLVGSIKSGNYDSGYEYAFKALDTISRAEAMHAKTGGRIDNIIFNMLHGPIPQTYTNTYLLVKHGSETTRRIADKIYDSVMMDAEKVLTVLKVNMLMVEKSRKKTS